MAFDLDDEELEATRRLNGVSMSEKDILNEIDFCLAGEYITIEHRKAIEGLLNLYQQEKELVTETEKQVEYLCDGIKGISKGFQQEKEKNKKLENLIDMMAEDISNSDIDEDICRQFKMKEDCYADTAEDGSACKNCIREYYFKKARGEE